MLRMCSVCVVSAYVSCGANARGMYGACGYMYGANIWCMSMVFCSIVGEILLYMSMSC